ncbi:hypothetical protein J4207_04860 [Candidatus Woesearchaeota archaeon]|nr:hypothetical protein [Candidatus Woesearchaeota archaeon]
MKRRELSDNVIEATEATPAETVGLLGRFNVGEYWEKAFWVPDSPQNTTAMMKYRDRLKDEGLDIGKGDAQFGYKMPIPEGATSTRFLHIFRRR